MESADEAGEAAKKSKVFYGWRIVAVGFLANIASTFALASTLSVFLKAITEQLGVSRGVFSLLRSGESIIGALLAPFIGTLVDRHGGRWLIAAGSVVVGVGYLILSQVETFWQFVLIRLTLVTVGDALMSSLVINVVLARWFLRKRGRAFAVSSMGVGFGKIGMPLFAAALLVWLGWRQAWAVFGLITVVLVVAPALLYVRRRPEDMGLQPDGFYGGADPGTAAARRRGAARPSIETGVVWSRGEAVRTRTFWLIVITFGISSIGVTGLNLHVFAYVSDIGHSAIVAATVMSVIAFTQLASPLLWGLLAERVDLRKAAMLRFVIQAAGLLLAVSTSDLFLLYFGFFLYGIGLGGNMVLPDLIWANYYGAVSLGAIRGLGLLLTNILAATGPPFFGFLFDLTGSYFLSFTLFSVALAVSAVLSLALHPPKKK
ncbi:MAG: MFS transporter [Candidatus Binatia bacterium]